jgi:cysteine desulfurase/selenocysteine lyase
MNAEVRAQFPALSGTVHGRPLVYLDTAASALKARPVLDAERTFLETDYANVHRGVHTLSQRATDAYEAARETVRRHIGAERTDEVVFTSGATDGINLVAQAWGGAHVGPGDVVLVTRMEHHANLVPWQLLVERTGAQLAVVEVSESGEFDEKDFQEKLKSAPKLVAFTAVSNVLGTVNDVPRWTKAAHAVGACVLVDACQAIAHGGVHVTEWGADFVVFSAHKVYGPTGIGVLYGRAEVLADLPPWRGGGDMIDKVDLERGTTFAPPPFRFEAGTPHISGAIGLAAALDFFAGFGPAAVAAHEQRLLDRATAGLSAIDGVRLIGTAAHRIGVVSFNLGAHHPYDVGTLLDARGIAVRTGHHCAQPLMDRWGLPGTVRASFGVYTTEADVDALIDGVERAARVLG